ncbi:MAG: YfhO family protein [Elusimicrobiota bacterium]|jgi:uncharacterized membrane protein YfhO|nr:YfhO family protein [Elusimicrobiota bacterium]
MNLKNTPHFLLYPSKNNYFRLYTFLFLIAATLFFFWHILNQKTFILPGDALSQHYPFLMYYGKYLRSIFFSFLSGNFAIPVYDFNIGYGSDIITTLNYYVLGDPLTLLSFFVPSKYCSYLYVFLFVLRLYLAGIAFSFYCFKTSHFKNENALPVLTGSFCYVFSGYTLLLMYVPLFLNPLIYFPLLLIGIEKILADSKPIFFIMMVFVSLISNFYFFYILTAMLFVWTTAQAFYNSIKIRVVFNLIFYYVVGVCCAAVTFIPNFINLLQSVRFNIKIPVDALYNADVYKNAFLNFITPPSNLLSIPYGLEMTGFPVISLMSIIVLFVQHPRYKALKSIFVLLTLCAFIPFCGYAFTAFSYVSNRWMFAYSFVVSLISAVVIENAVFSKKIKFWIFVFVVANVVFNSFYFFNKNRHTHHFLTSKEAFSVLNNSKFQAVPFLKDKSFFRVESIFEDTASINNSMITKFKGTTFYFSSTNPYVSRFIEHLELNRISTVMSSGLDSRAMLGAISNVKYFIIPNNPTYAKFLPYGYKSKINSAVSYNKKSYSVYKNAFALPFGYSYSCYITYEEFNKLSAIQKQQVFMQAAVLENQLTEDFNVLKKPIFRETNTNTFIFKRDYRTGTHKNNSVLTFPLIKNKNCEIYARFYGTSYFGDTYALVSVDKEANKEILYSFPKYLGIIGKQDFIFNMSYYDKNKISTKLISDKTDNISIDGVETISLPIDNRFEDQIRDLKRDCLKVVHEEINKIKCRINLTENKIILFSVPYSKGWKAVVNGKERKLLNANIMFMALPLKAGKYEIELKYLTPGLKMGILFSLLGFAIFTKLLIKNPKAKKHIVNRGCL